MFYIGIKQALTFLIPALVKEGYDYLTADKPTDKPISNETIRKKSDTTKVTQYMYDFIMHEFVSWRNTNFTKLSTGLTCRGHSAFCAHLNFELGLNKSQSSLSKLYNGHIDRASLPTGIGSGSEGVSA